MTSRRPGGEIGVGARAARNVLPLLIVIIVLASFRPLIDNNFVNWDDPFFFTNNPHYRGLMLAQLRWMFTTLHMGTYQPFTWLTHGFVYTIWGMNPVAYHVGSLFFHTANALVLFLLVQSLLRAAWYDDTHGDDGALYVAAAVGALFFAIHPLRVEAVAWATDRGQVLCTLFFLLAILAYVRMQTRKTLGGAWRGWYAMSIGCFTLSLLSGPAGITMPLVLLVLDIYPLRRLPRERKRAAGIQLIVEKIPYLVVAASAALLVLLARQREAMVTLTEHGVAARIMQVFYGLWFYLWKTVMPINLSPLYLLEKPLHPTAPRFVLSAVLVIAITCGLVLGRRRWPALLAAWASYVLILLPASGIMQTGPQITADRYTYLACLPWAVLVAAGVYRSRRSWTWPLGRWQLTVATIGILLLLSVRTSQQTRIWKDSFTLWNHVLSIEPNNFFAYNNRGHVRYVAGDVDGALGDFDRAIELNPNYDDAYDNRGTARLAKGDASGALADYTRALRINPRYHTAYYNRGNMRKATGDLDGAFADYQEALGLDPDYAAAYNARGRVYQAKGNLDAALADFSRAIQLNPEYANAYNNRGSARFSKGDLVGAIADCAEAIRLTSPNTPQKASFERNLARFRRELADRDQNR